MPSISISSNFAGALVYDPINDGMWLGTNDGLFFYDLKRQQLIEPFKGCLDVRGCIGNPTHQMESPRWDVQGMVEINLKSRSRGKGEFAVEYHPYKLDAPESGVIDKISLSVWRRMARFGWAAMATACIAIIIIRRERHT